MKFSSKCRLCPRLSQFLDEVKVTHPDYFAKPVPSFGDAEAKLLIVGLAPGMHGANRTGRPFTGDYAGDLLYSTLQQFGFSSSGEPLDAAGNANAKLVLKNCRITNAVRCLPPQNKPEPSEIKLCNGYLATELGSLSTGAAVLALGTIAHQAVLRASGLRAKDYAFGHGARHVLPSGVHYFSSYHCSRYNTQTKRLTAPMFHAVFQSINEYFESASL
jgi:uracil-DNA glycosylase family 4